MKRRITAHATFAIETESEVPLDQVRGWAQEHLELRVLTVPLPMKEQPPSEWESAQVTRVFVERITEQGG